jgi:hypothetical protein
MKTLAAFLLGMVAANHSLAGFDQSQSWIVVSGIAHHLNGNGYCNNRLTKGIGIEKDDWALGAYDNSNCELSLYAAKAWRPIKFGSWRAGLLGGVVSGYNSAVLPAAGLAMTYERKEWGANLLLIPPAGESSGVLWGQLKFKWK